MAIGFDELIDFLLSEVALCGVQGASSADFFRFIQTYHEQPRIRSAAISGDEDAPALPLRGLGRTFHERVWYWVSNHPDIRIVYKNEICTYSLSEFEAAELQETGGSGAKSTSDHVQPEITLVEGAKQPSEALSAMREVLRERLTKEGYGLKNDITLDSPASTIALSRPLPRSVPEVIRVAAPIFDEPESTITAPRLFASQNRIWQALTNHGIDLKKVPSMEFVLLSLIAARGADGITQPELTQLSGQDKRSVPHRTNELARKGYIVKNPVQAGKIRTSLCVHTKFISQNHFLTSGAVEDVFQEGTFVLSGFVHLLYSKLKDAGIVPTRDIRKKLGVPMRTWNKRATQGALIRLDQTGMIKRFRVRKKHHEDSWATCVQILREPRDEDVSNLGFRRQATAIDETVDELLDEDVDGDTLMRDLEVDMLDTGASSHVDMDANAQHDVETSGRIPPQWTPDRFLANMVYDVVALGGENGRDAEILRDRIIGPFWRRPMESYVTRLTDDWEKTQPLPLRHLAIIRDSRNTQEKKFIHYVYRTYGSFQKAVEAGEVHWEGVSKPMPNENITQQQNRSNKNATENTCLNVWGFQRLKPTDFIRSDGSATLSEVRSAIVHPRKYGPRWDNALTQEIGYQKSETPVSKLKTSRGKGRSASLGQSEGTERRPRILKMSKSKKKMPNISLTPEQRVSLGLKPNGRLSKSAEEQILAHRTTTGDPASLPDQIEENSTLRGQAPLMSAEERIAQGLPAKGRLGIALENEIRAERGLAKLPKKLKKREKKATKEPALLTKEQRLAFGWKGHGRLPQDLMDGLRQEREDGISLEDSSVLPKYMDALKAKATTPVAFDAAVLIEDTAVQERSSPSTSKHNLDGMQQSDENGLESQISSLPAIAGKRKADTTVIASSNLPKKQRTKSRASLVASTTAKSSDPLASPNEIVSQAVTSHATQRDDLLLLTDEDVGSAATPSHLREKDKPSASAPAEDDTLASVGAQSLLTSPTKTNMQNALRPSLILQPDVSSLDPQAQLLYGTYTSRSTPGLYLNPFARHRVPRGRPRKALIATFKLPRLREHEWFEHNVDDVQEPPRNASPGNSRASDINNTQHTPDDSSRTITAVDSLLIPPMNLQGKAQAPLSQLPPLLEDGNDRDRMFPVENGSFLQEHDALPNLNDGSTGEQVQPISNSASYSPECQPPHNAAAESSTEDQRKSESDEQNPAHINITRQTPIVAEQQVQKAGHNPLPSDAVPKELIPQSSTRPVSEAIAWTAINASAQRTPSTYKSPYAPSICPDPVLPPQSMDDTTGADVSIASNSLQQTPATEENANGSLSQEVYSAISEVQAPLLPEPKPRSKKHLNTEGSALLFRRNIIREIIDLCNGVFPDSGEIGRPFHTLWAERHGHIKGLKEPIASTVNSTMRNMCNHPRFGLKRMVFLVKNKNGQSTSRKEIITYAHFTPRSPEVLQLAYNIANFSLEKSHQYFPEQIRHLVDDTSLYYPLPVPPKDESIILNQANPELEAHIKEAQKRYRNEMARQRRLEKKARKAQNAQVEEAPSKRGVATDGVPRAKRARLASLNDKNKRYRRAPLQQATPEVIGEESEEHDAGDVSAAETDSSEDTPLTRERPVASSPVRRDAINEAYEEEDSELDGLRAEPLDLPRETVLDNTQNMLPHKHVTGQPQTTDIVLTRMRTAQSSDKGTDARFEPPVDSTALFQERKKRVRIADPADGASNKRTRLSNEDMASALDDDYIQISSAESDVPSSFESDLEDDGDSIHQPEKTKKRRFYGNRQRGKPGPLPTLLERLTGLTGDPNDPIYQQPLRHQRSGSHARPWSEKRIAVKKKRKERKYIEILDPADKFKRLCCTLVIASSMSGKDGNLDWRIVEKVYSSDRFFDIAQTKNLWTWMQTNMATQLSDLTTTFQSAFIEAYEGGQIPSIEDPDAYDWTSLVRWCMRNCSYPELPRPLCLEALQKFTVDESNYEVLNRARWYKEKIADRVRTQVQLHHSFTAPLHYPHPSHSSSEDNILKARSWVRANTATPQGLYNGSKAHEKLMVLGESLFVRVVGDYVDKQTLRMRKLKRLLPGRNYSFTNAFAKRFVRPFELDDFMAAVKIKKDMDAAFADEDPNKHFISISRTEEDGPMTAVMNLVSEGRIKLMPQLPPVNNEFGAPLPRLSKWGFCEGDYIHRAIDRNRLFWDIHVVPTANYQFGNPLQPSTSPPLPIEDGNSVLWPRLPDPPLPGKDNPDALLPIWSSIDGQTITWPWWYRILNLVLQPLIFQPGATPRDIHSHCPEHTTEVFEIELVLSWLESIGAVSKTAAGGYVSLPGFWAAFGDRLLDTEDDWFGEHVKRKAKNHEKQQWREDYNLRHSELQTRNARMGGADVAEEGDLMEAREVDAAELTATQQILKNPKRQYGIMQQALNPHNWQGEKEHSTPATLPRPTIAQKPSDSPIAVEELATVVSKATEAKGMSKEDVAVVDADVHDEDVDAEGEVDDAMY
ncbi:hypothetical protein BKA66DRAFT_467206 [Pyrenochaeta sp. MPI-SDFR-AT-0127]|nr:hypothetical protein BKA66DRAFT_467206 [Pyrenochaeta sp. MPI-SDFR-AT-0127]